MFGQQQAKFDLSQTGRCPCCDVPDDARHRVCECPRFQQARAGCEWICIEWDRLPVSFTHHLLLARNPHAATLARLLHELPDETARFHACPSPGDVQHVFTDGACEQFGHSSLALAAWGVTLGDSGLVISGSALPGIVQSAPRAQLTAMISAAKWVGHYRCRTVVWADAKNVVDGVSAIQAGVFPAFEENHDLWQTLQSLLDALPSEDFRVFHVPSHLSMELTAGPFEDWIARWNGHVDTVAGYVNGQRSAEFKSVHQAAVTYYTDMLQKQRALRGIYFRIAETTNRPQQVPEATEEHEQDWLLPAATWGPKVNDLELQLSVSWARVVAHRSSLPTDFVHDLCSFLWNQEATTDLAAHVSWLELVFVVDLSLGIDFPISGDNGNWVSAKSVVFKPTAPTVAGRLRFIRRALRESLSALGLQVLFRSGLDLSSLGVTFRLDGLVCGIDPALLRQARTHLADFCRGLRISNVGSLARPL